MPACWSSPQDPTSNGSRRNEHTRCQGSGNGASAPVRLLVRSVCHVDKPVYGATYPRINGRALEADVTHKRSRLYA